MKMPNKLLLPVIGLLVIAGGAFAYTRRGSSPIPAASTNQSANQTMSEGQEFAKAIESGKPTICVMAKGEETMEYRVKGKLLRANITASGRQSHMISDTQYFYMWVDGQKQGTKMSLTLPSPTTTTNPNTPTAPKLESEADYQGLKDQGYTINCQAGNVGDGEFVPPADVTFQDLSLMMQQTAPGAGAAGKIDYKKLQEQYGAMGDQ